MSTTPRTDDFERADCCDLEHALDFARQLERELATLKSECAKVGAMHSICLAERDALQAEIARLNAIHDEGEDESLKP